MGSKKERHIKLEGCIKNSLQCLVHHWIFAPFLTLGHAVLANGY